MSSEVAPTGTAAVRSPCATRSAALIQVADRRNQVIGERKADPHGAEQEDERHAAEDQRETDLNIGAVVLELAVFHGAIAGELQVVQHLLVEQADNIKIGLVISSELQETTDLVGLTRLQQDRHVLARLVDCFHVGMTVFTVGSISVRRMTLAFLSSK